MRLEVRVKCLPQAESADALRMRTNELLHASVDDHEMIDELLVRGAINAAQWTHRFATVRLHVGHEMQAIIVRGEFEFPTTDAAIYFRWSW